jgi:YVTN family beta-propeller protein
VGLVRFKLLGPLEAWVGAEPLPLGGAKQRALIAVLLLRPNEAVSTDRLVDELWGERPPASAAHSVEVYVSRLRKLFEEAGAGQVLVTRGHGYAAEIDLPGLDTREFERLAEKGRQALASGDYGDASRLLREALTLWRGEPLAELGLEGASALAIGRLTDLRLAVVEDRIEADLALGRHGALVGELGTLVREHPLRERLRRDLMLSLYRSGRQAEALEIYRDGRARLVGELGIEPGEELQRLQREILRQDPSLAAPTGGAAGRSRLRVAPAVAAALVLVGGGTVVAVLLATGGSNRSARSLAPNSIGALSTEGRLLGQVAGTATPTAAVAGAGSVWIASADDDTVSRIDDRSVQRTDQIAVGDRPGDVAFGENDVWVTNTATGTVSRIDPPADKVVQTVTVGSDPIGIAAGAGSIWVANSGDNTVTEIDGTSGHVVRTIPINVPVRSVAYAASAVWVTDPAGARVLRIDPSTGDVTASVPVGGGADAIASGHGSIWVANSDDGTVSRIDARTATLTATVRTGDGPHAFADGRRDVWVGNEFGDTVVRIDPRTNLVARSMKLTNRVEALAESGGRVFVATGAATGGHRGGTLTVIMSIIPFDTPDPALAYLPSSWNVLSMTNDGLVGFERVGGPDGTRLVPDLAEALPASTAHGTHYTFQLRSGIHYSNGTPVRPEDVRRALERVLELQSPGALYYARSSRRSTSISPSTWTTLKRRS